MSNNGTLVRNLIRGGSGGGGSATQVALLSVTTAPSGSFAVGSKYYDLATKKIVTAVTADTWVGATSADPAFNTIYTYDSGYYKWDGDNLVSTDVDAFIKGATVNGTSIVDVNKIAVIPNASNTVIGVSRFATDAEVETGTAENLAVNPKQLKDGLDSIVVPPATTEVEGIVEFATDSEVVTGTSETKVVTPKQLKDRGAEFEQSDFALQADILSSTTNKVVSNSKFFFFGNGDVSTDGKTIIKQTADFNADFSLACNENYVVCNYGNYFAGNFYIAIWKIGSDGTLTFIREFARPGGYDNTQIINGRLFVTTSGYGGQGIYYLDEIDFETETAMSFINGQPVKKVAYDTETEQYIIIRTDGVQISDDILDIYTQALLTFPGGDISGGTMLEGKLTVYTNIGDLYTLHQTVIGSGIINTITLPMPLYKTLLDLQKIDNKYVLIVRNEGDGKYYYYLATALTSFNADSDGVGYALANIGTNYVMVTDTNDILLSEEVKISILKSEITDSSTADITIANVAANTVYKYGEIDSLAITAVEVSNRKSIIYFSTSADFTTFTPPTAQAFIGSGAVVAEKSYKIEIENGIMEVKEFAVPA